MSQVCNGYSYLLKHCVILKITKTRPGEARPGNIRQEKTGLHPDKVVAPWV